MVIGGTHAGNNSSWADLADFPIAFGSGDGGKLWPYGTTSFYAYIVTPDRDYITISYQTYHSLNGVKNKLSEAGFVYDPNFGDDLTVTTPNGGEEFQIGDEMDIRWTTSLTGNVSVSLVGGTSDITIKSVTASLGSLKWTIPESVDTGSNYKISISDGSTTDESNGTFTIDAIDSCHLLIPQEKISISSFDSEQSGEEAINLLDGDKSTCWHTEWSPSEPDFPHEVVFGLDKQYGVSALKYTPRQSSENGRIDEYEIYVSEDTVNWGEPVKTGRFQNSAEDQVVTFDSTGGEFVKLVALSEVNGNNWAGAAEINLYYDTHYTGVANVSGFHSVDKYSEEVMLKAGTLSFTTEGKYVVSLYSTSGRILTTVHGIATGTEHVSLSSLALARGVYVLELVTGDLLTKKLITIE